MRPGVVLLLAFLALLLVVSGTGAVAESSGTERAQASAKGKCKPRQVAVTVNGKRSCKPFSKLFPKPKAIDLRLVDLRQTLSFDLAKAVGGRKGQRARTLQSGFGAAGKRAQKKLLKALPKALAFVDRKRGGASSSRSAAGPALASKGCAPGEAGPQGHADGATIGALGENGGFVEAPAGGGIRVRITWVSCGGVSNFGVPECPTANGGVDATGNRQFRATLEIWDGSQLVSRQTSNFDEKAKVHGEVGADAKLKFIEVEHTRELFIVASGGLVIRGGVTRKVRIEMPAGRFDPAGASVRFFGDSLSGDSGASAFADTADAAIRRYRSAESGWSSFERKPHCAEPIFSPPSNTLKLSKGKTGQLGIRARARMDGGTATAARWTLLNPENAQFSPLSSQDAAPTISYEVKSAPTNGFVKVTAKFTSTAGVGEAIWTQPTEQTGIKHITGTFGGELAAGKAGNGPQQSWSGTLTFDRLLSTGSGAAGLYMLSAGNVSITAGGYDGSGATGCKQHGSNTGKVLGGTVEVTGTGADEGAPYTYAIVLSLPFQSLKATLFDCPKQAQDEGYEGTVVDNTPVYKLSVSGQTSADGIAFAGAVGVPPLLETWTLQGTE